MSGSNTSGIYGNTGKLFPQGSSLFNLLKQLSLFLGFGLRLLLPISLKLAA
jgi:hypothetical protein